MGRDKDVLRPPIPLGPSPPSAPTFASPSRSHMCLGHESFISTLSVCIKGRVWCVAASGESRDSEACRAAPSSYLGPRDNDVVCIFSRAKDQYMARIKNSPSVWSPSPKHQRLVNYFWGLTKHFHYAWKTNGTIARAVKLLRWMVILFGVSHFFLRRRPKGFQSTGSDSKVDFDPCWLCPPTNLWVSFTVVHLLSCPEHLSCEIEMSPTGRSESDLFGASHQTTWVVFRASEQSKRK